MAQWLVKKLSKLMGVSVRTLHHYDEIGLLKPSIRLDNGYRLYSEADLQRLQQIVALKFFGFDLNQIKETLTAVLSLSDHLQLQSRLLARRAQAIADASAALDKVIAHHADGRSVDWTTIVTITETYSMIDALREKEFAQIVTASQLKDLVEFYSALARDQEAAEVVKQQGQLYYELKKLISQDPASADAIAWARQWTDLTRQLIRTSAFRGVGSSEVAAAVFVDFEKKSPELQKQIRLLLRETGRLVGERLGTAVFDFPEVTPAMTAWCQKAIFALVATSSNGPTPGASVSDWVECYRTIALNAELLALVNALVSHTELLACNMDTHQNGAFVKEWVGQWRVLGSRFREAFTAFPGCRLLLVAAVGGLGDEGVQRDQFIAHMRQAAGIVEKETGVAVPVVEGPTPAMQELLKKVALSEPGFGNSRDGEC